MTEPACTTCATCHRLVYVTDVNAQGHCILCAPEASASPAAPEASPVTPAMPARPHGRTDGGPEPTR